MQLLVVRHGECEANVLGVVAGARDDSLLTQHGIDEAEQTAQKLRGFQGRIVSSPLRRTYKTAEIIRDAIAPGTPIDLEPDFIELDVGDAMGKPLAEYFALEKSGEPIRNAETPDMLFERVSRGLEKLRQANMPTLLVTHNGTARMITCVLEHRPPKDFADVPKVQNGEVRTFEL